MSGEILIVSAVLLVALLPLARRALSDRSLVPRFVLGCCSPAASSWVGW
jgi:hypothetical protein